MRILSKVPDGGANSGSTAYFLIEWKAAFSIALLRFSGTTREAFHSHAFNAVTVWLWGRVREHTIGLFDYEHEAQVREWSAGDVKYTPRDLMHKVEPIGTAWALSFRGPWVDYWKERRTGRIVTLTHGRREVS